MKQNKTILVAEDSDHIFGLISKALDATPLVHPIIRIKTSRELGELLSAGAAAPGSAADAAYILIVDELLLQSEDPGFVSWVVRGDLRPRVLVIVLVEKDDQKTVNKYQGMGASLCILKSDVESDLSDTVSKLGSFLAVVQGPHA